MNLPTFKDSYIGKPLTISVEFSVPYFFSYLECLILIANIEDNVRIECGGGGNLHDLGSFE